MFQSLSVGLRRRWLRGLSAALGMLGAVWLLTEILTRVSRDANRWLDAHGTLYLSITAVLALLALIVSSYESRSASFVLPNTGTTLTLRFADILREEADWIVGVNEFFDSTLGDVVSAGSLHGKIISSVYGGNEAAFRSDVDDALATAVGEEVERPRGQRVRYPLGTVAVIRRDPWRIYLVAITRTDVATDRAGSTVPILWDALGEAIHVVDKVGNGAPLALPLIGNGRTSLNIPPQHLLRLITLKLSQESRRYDLPRRITIDLADECFEHLDLVEIKKGWSVV